MLQTWAIAGPERPCDRAGQRVGQIYPARKLRPSVSGRFIRIAHRSVPYRMSRMGTSSCSEGNRSLVRIVDPEQSPGVVFAPAKSGVAHARCVRRIRRQPCVGPRQRVHAAANHAFRPANAGLPSQSRCGTGRPRSGSTARRWPPWPRSRISTAPESALAPSPAAACAYSRPARH